MLILISGQPGNGKTLRAMALMFEEYERNAEGVKQGKEQPRRFFTNIAGATTDENPDAFPWVEKLVQAIADEWMLHPLGRKRYLVWNAVRGAAAALLKSNLDQAVARQTLIEELRRRSRWLLLQEEARTLSASDYCFAPALGWRTPLLVRVLQEHWLAEPAAYWALRPPTPE